jgi:hypothetical protein
MFPLHVSVLEAGFKFKLKFLHARNSYIGFVRGAGEIGRPLAVSLMVANVHGSHTGKSRPFITNH